MLEEIRLFGVFMPAALAWAVLALWLTFLLRKPLLRLPLRVLLWQPALLELLVFFALWWGISRLADVFLPHGTFFLT